MPPTPSETEDPNPLVIPKLEEKPQEPERVRVYVKSVTNLSRLYMLDIVEKGKKEIELILHLVNKALNPLMSPEIKRYRMTLDS
jgi:hypothetical protein